ncbi:putative transcription factor interactor and regulator CCHC(Zn) family [Helianthus debilis subsp. tardiflorus]
MASNQFKPPDILDKSINPSIGFNKSAEIDDITPGTVPIKGIGLRVTNIEGNPLMPRRGLFHTTKASVIDGLFETSKPADLEYMGEGSNNTLYDNMFEDEAYQNNDMGESEPGNTPFKKSYASVAEAGMSSKKINFRILKSDTKVEGADVVIPAASVKKVQNRFTNIIYGYFLGKRLLFPIVENYVKNTWAKYGIAKTMMNAHGFYFFKFNSKEGMEKVMENGPWLIRKLPIILNIWKPSSKLVKEDIKSVPIWTKLHDVPIAAFSEDGLSMIATNVGTPRMLDSYTASMCAESWGRNSYARALIEVNAEEELKESVVVAIPLKDEEGYSKSLVKIEYEWQPPRCNECKVFGHTDAKCPKQIIVQVKENGNKLEDGYEVVKKKHQAKQGLPTKKQGERFEYRPIPKNAKQAPRVINVIDELEKVTKPVQPMTDNAVKTSNMFDLLSDDRDDMNNNPGCNQRETDNKGQHENVDDCSDNEEVQEVYNETIQSIVGNPKHTEGASTPGENVSHV